jgi:hypothetical protein
MPTDITKEQHNSHNLIYLYELYIHFYVSRLFYPTDAQLNILFTLRFALKFTLKVLLHVPA